MRKLSLLLLPAFLSQPIPVSAAELKAIMHKVSEEGIGEEIGSISVVQVNGGVQLRLALKDLPAGPHGFHMHEKGDCGLVEKDGKKYPAGAAGAHYDPENTTVHEGPDGQGHKGDLPVIKVGSDGSARSVLSARRLTVKDMEGRSFVIHAGSDNYSDKPEPLGGGGGRIACGVIKKVGF